MKPFTPVYVPVGVPTFHMPSAQAAFEASRELLRSFDPNFVCPAEMLLSVDALGAFLDGVDPDLIVLQEPDAADNSLITVDVAGMVQKNAELLETLSQETIQGIYNIYREYKDDIDIYIKENRLKFGSVVMGSI